MIRPATSAGHAATLAGLAAVTTVFAIAPLAETSLERYQLPKELALLVLAALSVGAAVRRARFDGLDAALAGAGVAALVTAAGALNAWVGARLAALTVAAVVLALALRGEDASARDRARGWVIAAAGVLAAIALAEAYGVITGLSGHGRAPGATLGQRNAVAHVLAIALPFAWRASVVSARPSARWGSVLVVALAVATVVVTRSRAGWLAAAAGAAVLGLWAARDRSRRARHVGPMLAAIGGLVAAACSRPSLAWRTGHPYRDTLARLLDASAGSGRGRLVQIEASGRLVADHPWLGVGPGNWAIAYPSVSPPGDPTFDPDAWEHTGRLLTSDLASWVIERGALGTLTGIACVLALVLVLAKLEDSSHRAAGLACLAALVPLVLFDSVLQIAAPLAVTTVLLVPPLDRAARAWTVPSWTGPALAAVLLLAAAHRGLELHALALRAEGAPDHLARAAALDPGDYTSRARLAETLLAERDCARALPVLDEAIALRPHHARPRIEREVCERLAVARARSR